MYQMSQITQIHSNSEVSANSCQRGCRSAVPQELQADSICVLHFIIGVEDACSDMRREAATERVTPSRRREIEAYVKATAMKLSEVATSNTRLSDDLKKRVLSTFLTLMNLQESVDRSRSRSFILRPPQHVVPIGAPLATALR
jgi:hypothetical protein